MNERLARKLVNDYVEGWLDADSKKIISVLSRDGFITESHGPTYRGVTEVEKWASEWHKTGKVDKWTVDSFFYASEACFFEWSFTCTVAGKAESIDGCSIVQFNGNKIFHLHEYRMTKPAYDYFKK